MPNFSSRVLMLMYSVDNSRPRVAVYPVPPVDAAIKLFSSDNGSLQSVLRQQLERVPINFLICKAHRETLAGRYF